MLATLERGITGGKWYSLDDKVWKMENLQRAEKVAAGKSPKKGMAACRNMLAERPETAAAAANAAKKEIEPKPPTVWIPGWAAKNLTLESAAGRKPVVEMALRNV
jgi:hypothetical protein